MGFMDILEEGLDKYDDSQREHAQGIARRIVKETDEWLKLEIAKLMDASQSFASHTPAEQAKFGDALRQFAFDCYAKGAHTIVRLNLVSE